MKREVLRGLPFNLITMSFGHFHVDEGVNPHTGVRTEYFFEGDQVVTRKTWDAEPYIQRAKEMRARNEGKKWGEGREVGVIPPWAIHITHIPDRQERDREMKRFFRENPVFLAYDAFIK